MGEAHVRCELQADRASTGVHEVPIALPLPHIVQELWFLPRNLAILCMKAYRRVISPLYGEVCRYYPSCSRYAMEAFQQQGFLAGIALTAWRLLRCNPFTRGGVDDPPARKRPRYTLNARGYVRPVDRKAHSRGVY